MKKLKVKELIGYIFAGILVFGGLGLFITSVVGYYLPEGNGIESANWLGLGFKAWGLIALGVGLVLGLIFLLNNAKKADAEAERAAKRLARLGE